MLICAFKEQLALFPTLDSFEIDMSYKRVKDPDIREVVFAMFYEQQSKSKYFSTTS